MPGTKARHTLAPEEGLHWWAGERHPREEAIRADSATIITMAGERVCCHVLILLPLTPLFRCHICAIVPTMNCPTRGDEGRPFLTITRVFRSPHMAELLAQIYASLTSN